MWYIVRLDSSRVATLDKVRSATLISSDDPTRVKNYLPAKTTILRQIERCLGNSNLLVPCQLNNATLLYVCCPHLFIRTPGGWQVQSDLEIIEGHCYHEVPLCYCFDYTHICVAHIVLAQLLL